MEARNLGTRYNLPLLDWGKIVARLDQGITMAPGTGGPNRHSIWLATINPDGSPHLTGVGALFVDGTFWFESGDGTRKSQNLARDPRCAISLATNEFDLAVDGEAHKVTDRATVATMARHWAASGWPARVDQSGTALTAEFNAPSAGSPPWFVYRVTILRATAIGTVGLGGATRWEFERTLAESDKTASRRKP